MDNMALLLIFYLIYLALALLLLQGDVSAPSVLFFASFVIMLLLGNIYKQYFGFQIKTETLWIMVIAGFAFLLTECTYKYVFSRIHGRDLMRSSEKRHNREHAPTILSHKTQSVIVAYMVFSIIFATVVVLINTDRGTWNQRMYEFSQKTVITREPVKYLFLVSQIQKVAKALVYIIFYILMYNKIICKFPLKKQKGYILIVLLFVPLTLLQGYRRGLLELIVFFFVGYVLLLGTHQNKVKLLKLLIKIMPIMIVFIYAFTELAASVGRRDIEREAGVYVTTYLCGGLKYFDELIVGKPCSTRFFGQSTFSGVYTFLTDRLKVLPPEANLSYRLSGPFGNTATIFARWYEDFGSVGVVVMTILVAIFFSWLHQKAVTADPPGLPQVFYALWSLIIVLASYDDKVTTLFTTSNLIVICLIWAFYRFYIGGGRRKFAIGNRLLTRKKDI